VHYNDLIRPARERVLAKRGVVGITSQETHPRTMAAFLLHFSALSISITEPVEGWLCRAGDRWVQVGLAELGRALQAHSKAEAGHHEYHVADFRSLVPFWHSRWSPAISADDIAHKRMTDGGAHEHQRRPPLPRRPGPWQGAELVRTVVKNIS
jgi:hypothetical protein